MVPYQLLQGGMLTGKYRRGQEAPAGSRLAEKPEWMKPFTDETYDVIERCAAEAAAEEAFLELPRLADDAASEEEAEPALEPFALDEPDFEVDYRLWLIEYADGSTRTFDSHARTLA